MKKIVCIMSLMIIILSAYAQDDKYYDNSNTDDVYNNDVYNNDGYNEQNQDNEGMSYQAFYDDLDRYGSWIQNPTYGYVWVPLQAGAGFSPYLTNGHWEYTDYGWTWVSDFEWGWATFHYGRWYEDPGYGWVWVPGYDWAPAWVVWGEYDNYYCWAPAWPGEYTSTHFGGREHHWYFVDHNHINDHQISNQVVSNTVVNHNKTDIESHINIISHVNTYSRSVFFAGPKVKEVEKAIGHPIEKVNVTAADKAGATRVNGHEIAVYRPDIKRVEKQDATPAHIGHAQDMPRTNEGSAQPQRTMPQRQTTIPQRDDINQGNQQPAQHPWTPPRQSIPREQMPQAQPVQQHPIERGGGFVPAERAVPQQQRQFSSPAPVRQSAPPPMHMGGGGRHQ
ncbi:MAG: hypothetical protein JWO03_3985 [Bacteroidetes bacterium]|nr:hypothetical protein [Bacteroidota bacterium]